MTAREQILRSLRTRRGPLPAVETPGTPERLTAAAQECVARFAAEATALGIECFVESSAAAVTQRLATLVDGLRVLSWDAAQLPYDAAHALPHAITGRASWHDQAAAEIGVTGCDAAIAETASLVLVSGPGRSRSVSLLPPVHVALIERSQMFLTMAEVFDAYSERFTRAAACTVITGPSRTADIELTLTLGIHGPGRVVVIIGP